jgi:mono/diheme cytochrome c family protein
MSVRSFVATTVLALAAVWTLAPVSQARQVTAPVIHPKVTRVDFDMKKVAEAPALTETELKGRRLFFQNCGVCHASGGRANTYGPWLDGGTVTRLGEAKFQSVMAGTHPTRPGRKAAAVSPEDVAQIIAYVKTGTPQPPPPARTP